MSYAVLHIIKANSSLNSIAKHIERTSPSRQRRPGADAPQPLRAGRISRRDNRACGGCRTPHSQCRDNPENLRPAGTLPHILGNFSSRIVCDNAKNIPNMPKGDIPLETPERLNVKPYTTIAPQQNSFAYELRSAPHHQGELVFELDSQAYRAHLPSRQRRPGADAPQPLRAGRISRRDNRACGGCRTPHSQCRDNPENLRPAGTLPHILGNFSSRIVCDNAKNIPNMPKGDIPLKPRNGLM